MFEMYKYILDKVSFDEFLFRKELFKAIKSINADEKQSLEVWCLSAFGPLYKNTLYEAFSNPDVFTQE